MSTPIPHRPTGAFVGAAWAALLIGAISAFVVIAAVMVLTRNLNWYGNTETE